MQDTITAIGSTSQYNKYSELASLQSLIEPLSKKISEISLQSQTAFVSGSKETILSLFHDAREKVIEVKQYWTPAVTHLKAMLEKREQKLLRAMYTTLILGGIFIVLGLLFGFIVSRNLSIGIRKISLYLTELTKNNLYISIEQNSHTFEIKEMEGNCSLLQEKLKEKNEAIFLEQKELEEKASTEKKQALKSLAEVFDSKII